MSMVGWGGFDSKVTKHEWSGLIPWVLREQIHGYLFLVFSYGILVLNPSPMFVTGLILVSEKKLVLVRFFTLFIQLCLTFSEQLFEIINMTVF